MLNYSIVASLTQHCRPQTTEQQIARNFKKKTRCCSKVTRRGFQKSVTTFHEYTDSDHHVVKSARHCIHERVNGWRTMNGFSMKLDIVIQSGLCPFRKQFLVRERGGLHVRVSILTQTVLCSLGQKWPSSQGGGKLA